METSSQRPNCIPRCSAPTYRLAASTAACWRAVAALSHGWVSDCRAQLQWGGQHGRRCRQRRGLRLARTAAAVHLRLATRPVGRFAALPACHWRLGRCGGKHARQLLCGRRLRCQPAGCWLLCWLPLLLLVFVLLVLLLLLLGDGTKPLRLGVGRSNQALELSRDCLAAWRRRDGGGELRWCSGRRRAQPARDIGLVLEGAVQAVAVDASSGDGRQWRRAARHIGRGGLSGGGGSGGRGGQVCWLVKQQ